MAPSFWGGFDEPERDFPSSSSAALFRESVNASPEWGDMNNREKDDVRERYIDDIATGDVRDLRDWLDTLDIDWARDDFLSWLEDVDTDLWNADDWEAWRSMYA